MSFKPLETFCAEPTHSQVGDKTPGHKGLWDKGWDQTPQLYIKAYLFRRGTTCVLCDRITSGQL